MQQLSRIDTVVFDKTGTLTDGQLSVTDVIPLERDAKYVLTLATSLEHMSDHSLAKAIIRNADKRHLHPLPVRDFRVIAGRGISALSGERGYYLGNEALVREYIHDDLPDVNKASTG